MKDHPYISVQPPVFLDEPAQAALTADPEWVPLTEAINSTGGALLSGSRLLVNDRPAVLTVDPYIGTCSAKYTDTPDSYALNIATAPHQVRVHAEAITATREQMSAAQS